MSPGVPATQTFRTQTAPSRGSQYALLLRQVKQAGLLDRRTGYYLWIASPRVLLAGGWVAFVLVGESWWQLAVAVFLAVVFAQVGFLAHDAGHQQIFTTRAATTCAGFLLANLAIGLGYGFWVDNHNRHHAHPNTGRQRPRHRPSAPWPSPPARPAVAARLARLAYRYQAYFFFPLLLLTAFGLHVDSAVYLAGPGRPARAWERVLFAAHVVGYLGVVFWVSPRSRPRCSSWYSKACSACTWASPSPPTTRACRSSTPTTDSDFLRRQVLTSRNVRGSRLVDLALGGLNYQIEHHLFPSMPRPNLRHAQPIIRRFCHQHGLTYAETSLTDSYAQTLRHLHSVGRNPSPATRS